MDDAQQTGRPLAWVEVPLYRLGTREWRIYLRGEPDPEYGYLFSPAEADRWARARAALERLAALEGGARGDPPGFALGGGRSPGAPVSTRETATTHRAGTRETVHAPQQLTLPLGPR